jgi:hypothetical protein
MADKIWRMVQALMPDTARTSRGLRKRVIDLANEAQAAADVKFGLEEAIAWGEGYEIPKEIMSRDEEDLEKCGFDLEALVEMRKEELAMDRLSVARVDRLTRGNPEHDNLLKLVVGMPVVVSDDFKPNGNQWPRMRTDYEEAHSAVDRSFVESFVKKGLAVVLSEETVRKKLGDDIHMSVAGWAPKYGKQAGRPLTDCSSGGREGFPALNSVAAKEKSDELYGIVEHPTLGDLVAMVLEMEDQRGSAVNDDELILWAADVDSAYTKIFFMTTWVRWMAVQLVGGMVIFFLAGIFGWTGTPAAFAVVTRALEFEFQKKLPGKCKMYVDDAMGVCQNRDLERVLKGMEETVCDLLGPGALAAAKTKTGRRLDFIGWTLDLDTRRVTIARKNVLRAIYGFFTVGDSKEPVSVQTMERLASWGSRYSEVCGAMRPYVCLLYASYKGKHRLAKIVVSEEIKQVCRLFQTLLVLSEVEEMDFSRPFDTFREKEGAPTVILETDAALFGGGGLIHVPNPDGTERLVGAFDVDTRCLEFGTDSSFQNVSEFLTAAVGLKTAKELGLDVSRPHFRLDNTTAISWTQKKFRGTQVTQAGLVWVFMLAAYGVDWVSASHIAGIANTRADGLSRGVPWEVLRRDHPELKEVPLHHASESTMALVRHCDPRRGAKSDEMLAEEWRSILAILRQ